MKKLIALRVMAIMTASGFAGWGYWSAWHTFVTWWEPLLWAALGSAACCRLLMPAGRHMMPGMSRKAVVAIVWVWTAMVIYGAGLGINYSFADTTTTHSVEAVVTGRHSEERTRYRRVGRGRSVPDGTYKVYYVTVSFPNGVKRDLPVNANGYRNARNGQTRSFEVSDGLFGYKIFRRPVND